MFSSFKGKIGYIGAMGVKLDLEKAYDLINWEFIQYVLSRFEFAEKWVSFIMEHITSTSFSVLINGNAHGYFYLKRGIRQGDVYPHIFSFFV